jgi:hypothetical protein
VIVTADVVVERYVIHVGIGGKRPVVGELGYWTPTCPPCSAQ